MPPMPLSPYAASKVACEYYCKAFTACYGLETVCLRYFNIFGPRQDPQSQYAAVIPRFITRMLDGQPPVIFGRRTCWPARPRAPWEGHSTWLAADATR